MQRYTTSAGDDHPDAIAYALVHSAHQTADALAMIWSAVRRQINGFGG